MSGNSKVPPPPPQPKSIRDTAPQPRLTKGSVYPPKTPPSGKK